MLEKAKAKSVYDNLFETELVSFMAGHADSYDAILGAATLIHFGDLTALFQTALRSLRASGLFAFTLFPAEAGGDYAAAANTRLAQSGCFTQWQDSHVERLAAETGFSVAALDKLTHEQDQDGQPVAGILAVLRRTR